MRNSNEQPKEKRRAIRAGLCFLAGIILFSAILFYPQARMFSPYRGYDTLVLGASHSYKAIKPYLLDDYAGTDSYVIASDSCTVKARYWLAKSALKSDTLDTVILEISYNAMMEDLSETDPVFYIEPMTKVYGPLAKIRFCLDNFSFWEDDYDQVYPNMLDLGIDKWKRHLLHRDELIYKGYIPFGTIDQTLTAQEAKDTYNMYTIDTDYYPEDKQYVKDTIEMCKEAGKRVVLLVTPVTEMRLWQDDGWDNYRDQLLELADEYDCELYDFNLYKDRQKLWNDSDDFADTTHMSWEGADVFTPLLAKTLVAGAKGEDVSDQFYDSYAEAKEHSSYWALIQDQ